MSNSSDNELLNRFMKGSDGNHISENEILNSLLNSKDIEMKTEIYNPFALTGLELYKEYFKTHKAGKTSGTVNLWIRKILIYMVSKDRESRREITQTLSNMIQSRRQKKTILSDLADEVENI